MRLPRGRFKSAISRMRSGIPRSELIMSQVVEPINFNHFDAAKIITAIDLDIAFSTQTIN